MDGNVGCKKRMVILNCKLYGEKGEIGMELITILISVIVLLMILLFVVRFNKRNIMLIKQIGEDKELNEITNVLPDNEHICKEILTVLGNDSVNIKFGSENSQASLYIVATNSIIIANVKNTFTRVQTIAHECIHSVQDKRLLWFNFVFSNIYLVYFAAITVLALVNKLPNGGVFGIVLLAMSMLMYFVRSFLEVDAMIRARFVAKEYMESHQELISKDKIDLVVDNYDRLNDVGVKFYCFKLMFDYLVKVAVFCLVAIF